MIGVYLHIPFCKKICPYCDFVKRTLKGADADAFVEALCREIATYEGPTRAGSISFGGGTPSMLTPPQFTRILATLRGRFDFIDPEVSIEANPDDITTENLAAWRDLGINRLSLGVQSFDDEALRHLGRAHDAAQARRACEAVSESFANWSLDLMFGVRPFDRWEQTLRCAAEIAPPHLSSYGLTYEPKTRFAKLADQAIDDEEYVAQFWRVEERLPHLRRYEVSNLARPGHESRHNLLYWRNEAYAGFGPGAYSFIDGVRARNLSKYRAYLETPGAKEEALHLRLDEVKVETAIQALRLAEGLDKTRYASRFGCEVEADFGPQLRELVARGLIEEDTQAIRPTRKGFELNNEIGLALVEGKSAKA